MIKKVFLLFVVVTIIACASSEAVKKLPLEETQISQIPPPESPPKKSEPSAPDFLPVSEQLSPLKTRIVSISARATPLKDVLHVIAEATGLNLVIEKGVDPEIPVNLTLKHVSAEDALNTILSSVDYFHSLKENILIVKAMDTKIFEFGQPSVIQDYNVDVGGDILGGLTTGSTGTTGTTSTTGTTGTTGYGTTGIRGNVTQNIKTDNASFKFWDSIENTIATLLGSGSGQQSSSEAVQLKPSFSINRMTGTVVVTATKRDLEKVKNYLADLKKILGRQVIIEARIVEVQLSESLEYGIDWAAVMDVSDSAQLTVGTYNFSDAASSLSPNFQINLTGGDFTGLLKALQSQGDISVLSNPRVNIMNGQTALLSVGRNTTFIDSVETTTTSTGDVATITYTIQTNTILSGIMIGIVPYINENGEITMTITPIVSDLVKLEEKTTGSGDNATSISLPTTDLRELSTTIKVKDGEMIIIGGLIQNKESLQDNQIPFLGDIPIIGYLFKSREQIKERTELVIMLKPTVAL
ncbi:MAG: pilus (MSHA type) biogenesis protein MshL [Nitrospirota bacterium]